jgi:pantoate--beta-alanine ligase
MSSRNGYLSADERAGATGLHAALRQVAEQLVKGRRDFNTLEDEAVSLLESKGFRPDYVSVRKAVDLSPPERAPGRVVVLGAARLGRTRLIDNLLVDLD